MAGGGTIWMKYRDKIQKPWKTTDYVDLKMPQIIAESVFIKIAVFMKLKYVRKYF